MKEHIVIHRISLAAIQREEQKESDGLMPCCTTGSIGKRRALLSACRTGKRSDI